jgi:hypothetical protein
VIGLNPLPETSITVPTGPLLGLSFMTAPDDEAMVRVIWVGEEPPAQEVAVLYPDATLTSM